MTSKFANLLSQARNRPNDEIEPEVEKGSEQALVAEEIMRPPVATAVIPSAPKTKNLPATAPARSKSALMRLKPEESNSAEISVRGRPRTGKRSDPNYTQITAYITKNTHRDVKLALLQEDNGREISEVIEELLASWLAKHK